MEGDGNCMPNAILLQLGFDSGDNDGKDLYKQMYLRRQAIRHLLMNWKLLGKEIANDVAMQYGRPDSEVDGKLICKQVKKKGQPTKKVYGYSVYEWCENVLKDKFWLDEIFLKLVASMWSCRITVIRSDSLRTVDYRHDLFFSQADIVLMYNSCPFRGHYSAVIRCSGSGQYIVAEIEPVVFTDFYRKHVDLDERLNRGDNTWDLEREKQIFTKKRGYKWANEDKEEVAGRKDGGGEKESGSGDSGEIRLAADEIIVKKEEWKKMEDEIADLKKEVEKMDDLKKEIERLKEVLGDDEEGKVVVEEKSMESLREDIGSLKRKFDEVMAGKEIEDTGTSSGTAPQKKSRAHDPDQPPDPKIAKLVRGKRVEVRREIADDLEEVEKGSTVCPVCKEDYITQNAIVSHYSKFHKNEYLYHCKECGKEFMSRLGFKLHAGAHNEAKRLPCEDKTCDQKFGSKSTVKKHMKEQHPTEEQMKERENIKCQYCQKKFKTKDNKNEHELGCAGNPEREELTCEVCDLGGFYVNKRVLAHKRTCHGWEG